MANGRGEERTLHAMSIDDTYHVERVLASGPRGAVELVTIDGSGPYLRKRIPLSLANRKVWAALAECSCPRLPGVAATYDTPDELVVVCDFVPGDTLAHRVEEAHGLPAHEAVSLVLQLAEAVGELHRFGIVHCDITPENVVVAADGTHLIDLGNAQMLGYKTPADEHPFGTWGFAAPEQLGFAPVDERTDVFALGRILGFALTGARPDEASYATLLEDTTLVPPALVAVAQKACAFEPSERFGAVADFAEAVRRAAEAASATSALKRQPAPFAAPSPSSAYAASQVSESAAAPASAPTPASAPSQGVSSGVVCASSVPRGAAQRKQRHGRRVALLLGLVSLAVILLVGFQFFGGGAHNFFSLRPLALSGFGAFAPGGGVSSEVQQEPPALTDERASASSAAATADESAAADALSLVESAWYADDTGLISYTFILRNESETLTIDFPAVDIVARDASGNLLSTDCAMFLRIGPGRTLYANGVAGNGALPSSVEFVPRAPGADDVREVSDEGPAFRVVGLTERLDELNGTCFVGDVSLVGEAVPDSDTIFVVVLLRDDQGRLVGGASGYVHGPAPGETVPFEVNGWNLPPHASCEAYAQEW